MLRLVLALCICFACLGGCVHNRPILIQGLIGVTSFDDIEFAGSTVAAGPTAEVELDALPALGFSLQKPVSPSKYALDIGWEGGMSVGWDTQSIAFRGGGGGAVVAIRANMVFLDFFGGAYVSRTFQRGAFRIYAGAGPLFLWAWASEAERGLDPADHFDDSSGELGTYVRAGIEFNIGAAGMLGVTVQRIDSEVDFATVGSADVEGYVFAISLTREI